MSTIKKIQFQTLIHAPVDVVWERMLGADTYPQWTKAFAEGSYFEGAWSKGSRIRFLAPHGDGMIAEIAENIPHQFLSIRHIGYIYDGVEDTDSEEVLSWAPAYENYSFSTVAEGTKLVIDQDITDDYETYMNEAWPKALGLLKQLCVSR